MNESGSLCPAVKAADMIGDKWVLLIMRELFLGSTRYNDFQRALPRISPTILSKRLKQLEADGLIVKKPAPGRRASEYRLTRCGRELAPLIDQMSKWGLRWARRQIIDEDIDVAGFMWDLHRSMDTSELPDGETVFCVHFPELPKYERWWLVACDGKVDLCTDDPGKDVDLFIAGALPVMVEVWMGDADIKTAMSKETILMTGAPYLAKSASRWFPKSRYANVRPKRLVGLAQTEPI